MSFLNFEDSGPSGDVGNGGGKDGLDADRWEVKRE